MSRTHKTETIIIGSDNKKPNHIEFKCVLSTDLQFTPIDNNTFIQYYPEKYKYIELICQSYVPGIDLMFAYNDKNKRHEGILFIGKWNNGTVNN